MHTKKHKYSNLDNKDIKITFKTFFRWHKERIFKKKDFSFSMPQASKKEIEFLEDNRILPSLTWIGHATFLIQLNGLNILTDPVWANRMGLAKRMAPPGLKSSDLPEIDVVLISHNHYDHLDFKSLYNLRRNPKYLVPKGLGSLFGKKGLTNYLEFAWWENVEIDKVNFTFVPSQHWSKRLIFDTNTSLWGSWIVRNQTESLYFVGDSGYFRGFKEVGRKYKINYFLGPIGCYEPEWVTKLQHMSPEQSIQAYLDCHADYFIPMHFEAFRLADETPKEALDRLIDYWEKQKQFPEKLKILKLGETIKL